MLNATAHHSAATERRTCAWQVNAMAGSVPADLGLLAASVAMTRRVVHAGDSLYEAGDRFQHLHIINIGMFKVINQSADGREQVVGVQFRGDWLGFDGIGSGRHGCDAVAMDTGEVWSMRYEDLLQACLQHPELMNLLHVAMSRELTRDRDAMLSMCTLPADARVAEFVRNWAAALSARGLRDDQILLRMTRAEIGNYLGMKLETVSRALSRLARDGLIAFSEGGRRDIRIPELSRLDAFIQRCLSADNATLQ